MLRLGIETERELENVCACVCTYRPYHDGYGWLNKSTSHTRHCGPLARIITMAYTSHIVALVCVDQALYDFVPKETDELELIVGDVVEAEQPAPGTCVSCMHT